MIRISGFCRVLVLCTPAMAAVPLLPAHATEPPLALGFDGKTISVAEIEALTGPAANFGLAVSNGLKTWFQHVNDEKGGIGGRYKVDIVTEDNANLQAPTVQAYNKVKNDVVMIGLLFGTHTTLAVLPQINQDKTVVGATGYDSQLYREPQLLVVGTTYQVMAINAIDYLVQHQNAANKVFCALIRDDPYGIAGLEGVQFAAQKLKLKLPLVARFSITDQDFSGQISQIKGSQCDYVFATTIPPQLVRMVGDSVRIGFAPTWIVQFPSWTGSLVNSPAMDYFEKHLFVASEGVAWGDESVPGMAQMIALQKKYIPEQRPDFFFVLGYRQGIAVTAVLEKAVAQGDLSREGLLKAMNSIKTIDVGGLSGDQVFGPPDQRRPPKTSSLFKANRKMPYGLEAIDTNFTTDTAAQYGKQ